MFKKFVVPLLIIAGAVGVTLVMARMRSEPEQSTASEPVVLVETITIAPQNAYINVLSQGTVEARTRTSLISEVSGQVIEVSPAFVTGGFFRKGELLLKLDDQNYRAVVSRQEAAVATARSALAMEEGQTDVAQREWDRMTAAQQAQVRAKELYLRKPQLAEAQARLASALADLDAALNDLTKTTIVAPYDGLVSSKNTDIGQYVNAGNTLAETFAVDYVEVRLPIPESKIPFLDLPDTIRSREAAAAKGAEVTLISRIGDRESSWQGHLTRTEGVLDIRTRVMFSVVQVEDPYGLYGTAREEPLRIGTYVNAAIQGQLLENVYVLPRHTLQANNLVWVADQEDRLRSRSVELVTTNGDDAFVASGFLPGDRVVITRMESPLNGMRVQTDTVFNTIN